MNAAVRQMSISFWGTCCELFDIFAQAHRLVRGIPMLLLGRFENQLILALGAGTNFLNLPGVGPVVLYALAATQVPPRLKHPPLRVLLAISEAG